MTKSIYSLLIVILFLVQSNNLLAMAGGGGGGTPNGTNLTCGSPDSFSLGSNGFVGSNPTSATGSCGQCCYSGSDLDGDGDADVTFSLENAVWYEYCNNSGSTITIDIIVDEVNNNCNVQGAVFVGPSGGTDVIDCSNPEFQEYGSNPGGNGDGFSFTVDVPDGECAFILVDGYGGATCSELTIEIPCPINCTPPTNISATATPICEGESTTINANISGGTIFGSTVYSWSPTQGLSCSNCEDPNASPSSTTTYILTACNDGVGNTCCATTEVTVDVTPLFTPDAGPDVVVCQNGSAVLGGSPTGPVGSNYSWVEIINNNGISLAGGQSSNENPTVNVSGTASGSATYEVTVTNGACVFTDQVTVTVGNIVVDAGTDFNACPGDVVSIGGNPTAPNGSSYSWSESGNNNNVAISGSNTIANPSVTIGASATGTVEYTVDADLSGCTGTDAIIITIDPLPSAPTATASPASVCAGTNSTLTASGGAGSGTYSWLDAPSGNIIGTADNLVVAPTTTTTYYLISTDATSGCNSLEGSITVPVTPAPVANAGTDIIGCEGNSLNLSGSISNPDGVCTPTQTWTVITGSGSFDDPNSLTAVFTPTGTGLIQLELTPCASGGCAAVSDIIDINITVSPTVVASSQDTELCQGLITNLDASASGGTPTPPTIITEGPFASIGGPFSIPNNDCSTGVSSSISVSGVSNSTVGTTTITICVNTDLNGNDDVSLVLCAPGGSPCLTLIPAPNNGLSGNNFTGTCFSSDGLALSGGAPYTGDWLPLGGNISDLNGASTNGTWTLTVYDCAGGASGELDDWSLTFETPVSTDAYSYFWTPSDQIDDQTISTPTFFSNGLIAGTNYCLDVLVTDDNNCTATDQVCIDIIDIPVSVDAGTAAPQCATSFNLNGSVLGIDETGMWSVISGTGTFDDDSNPTAVVSGLSIGDNVFEWTVTNSCGSTSDQITIEIIGPPTATIISNNSDICEGQEAIWQISGTSGAVLTYDINGGSDNTVTLTGGTASISQPNSISNQTLNITLIDDGSCSQVLNESSIVNVNSLPILTFTTLNDICVNETVQTLLSGATPVGGEFFGPGVTDNGNGSTYSFDPNAAGVGIHTISYTYTDGNSCTDTITDQVEVFATPVVALTDPGDFCSNDPVQAGLNGGTPLGGTYSGPGVTDNANDTYDFSPSGAGVGVHDIVYSFTDGNSCSSSDTVQVEVFLAPVLTFPVLNDVCIDAGNQILGGATPSGGVYSGTGVTDDGNGTSFTFDPNIAGVGTHTITYNYTDGNSCSDFTTQTITVDDTPTINGTLEACIGQTQNLVGSGTPNATNPWISSNGAIAGVDVNGQVSAVADGSVTITYTDINGCTADSIFTVNPTPVITLDTLSPSVCDGLDGQITVNGAGTGTVTWSGAAAGNDSPVALPYVITGLGAGNYNVFFTDDATTCSSASVAAILLNPGAPEVFPIDDTASCEIDFIVPDPVTFTSGNNLTAGIAFYSASGGNAGDLIPQGTPITSAMSPMTIFVYDNNGTCDAEVSFIVNVNTNPTAAISPDPAEACEGNAINLNGNPAGGSGTYTSHTWTGDVAILNATNIVNPIVSTLTTPNTYNLTYQVIDNNGCTITDDIQVVINDVPDLSGTLDVCVGLTTTILSTGTPDAVTPWTSSNPAVATVDNAGVVTGVTAGSTDITFLDDNGCSNTVTVTVNALPVISLTPTQPTGCNLTNGSLLIQLVSGLGSGSIALGGDSVNTFNPITLPYTISNLGAGTYDVILTDNNSCVSNNPSETLINPNAPIINPISDTISCAINFVVPDAATWVTGTDLTGNQEFYDTPGGNIADLVAATTVITAAMSPMTLYAYDANGSCNTEESFVITINALPTINIAGNNPICDGEDITLTENGGSANSWNWSSLNGSATFDDNTTDLTTISGAVNNEEFQVVVTDANNCSDSASVVVTVNTLPTVNISGNNPICDGEDITLTENGGSANSWNWSSLNGSATFDDNTTDLTTISGAVNNEEFQVVVTDVNNCSDSASVVVTVNALPTVNISGNNPICDGEDITLTEDGGSATSWNWSSLNGSATFNDNTTDVTTISDAVNNEEFQVVVTDANNCSDTASVIVTVNALPTVNISGNNPICDGQDITLTEDGGDATSWNWSSLNGSATFNDNTLAGTTISGVANFEQIQVVVTDVNNCSDSDYVFISVVNNPSIDPLDPITACDSYDLPPILGTNLSGNQAYYDDTQINGGNIIAGPITATSTIYMYDGANGCEDEQLVQITINNAPSVTGLPSDATYCDFENIADLNVDVSGIADWTIYYSIDGVNQSLTSSSAPINIGNNPGTYVIDSIADLNCTGISNESFTITVNPTPLAPTVSDDGEFCSTDQIPNITANGGSGTFNWYLDDNLSQLFGQGPEIAPINQNGITTYYVTETANNCEGLSSLVNITINDCELIIPTAFTPNYDGNNDTWEISPLDDAYPNNAVFIYNRWGALLFEHNSQTDGPYNNNQWDGTFNGEELPVGSYFFVIQLNDQIGQSINGAVSIIKE